MIKFNFINLEKFTSGESLFAGVIREIRSLRIAKKMKKQKKIERTFFSAEEMIDYLNECKSTLYNIEEDLKNDNVLINSDHDLKKKLKYVNKEIERVSSMGVQMSTIKLVDLIDIVVPLLSKQQGIEYLAKSVSEEDLAIWFSDKKIPFYIFPERYIIIAPVDISSLFSDFVEKNSEVSYEQQINERCLILREKDKYTLLDSQLHLLPEFQKFPIIKKLAFAIVAQNLKKERREPSYQFRKKRNV